MIERWASALLVLLIAASCDPGAYHEWTRLQTEQGYSIAYLAPPWEVVTEGAQTQLAVRGNASVFGSEDAAFQPKYDLTIRVQSGNPARLSAREFSAIDTADVLFRDQDVSTQTGVLGREFAFASGMSQVRVAFLEHPRGTLRLEFRGTAKADSAEVTAMIASVRVEP